MSNDQEVKVKTKLWVVYFGTLVTTLSGLILIAAGYHFSKESDVLWALLLVIWMIPNVYTRREYVPILQGLIALIGCAFLGLMMYMMETAHAMWGLILIAWLISEMD